MQHIIARAIIEADTLRLQAENERVKKARDEWWDKIGYKEYSHDIPVIGPVRTYINALWCFIKLRFISKEKLHGVRAASALIQTLLCLCFLLADGIFLVFSGYFLFKKHFFNAFVAFICSIFFRIARIEVEDIKDESRLFGLFESVMTIISIFIAIVSVAISVTS